MGFNRNIKAYSKDTIMYIPGKIVEGIMGFITIYYFTKLFSPEEYGLYSLLISGIGLLSSLSIGWLNQSLLRYYGVEEYKESYYKTLFNIWLFVNLFIILIGLITTIIIQFFRSELYLSIILIFVLNTTNTWRLLQTLLRAKRKTLFYTIFLSIGQILKFTLTILIYVLFDLSIISIFISLFIIDFISITITIIYLKITPDIRKSNWSVSLYEAFKKFGFPLIGVSVIAWILSASDRYFIAMYRGNSEVGMYSTAYSLVAQPLALITGTLILSATPIIIKSWNKDGKEDTEKLVSSIIIYYLMLMIPAIVGIILLKEEIFTFLIDYRYYNANEILPWIASGIFFMGLSQYINKIWELKQETKRIFTLNIVTALINFILNVIFIPVFGYKGAAITTLLAYVFLFIASIHINYKVFKIRINLEVLYKIILATSIMSLFIYFMEKSIESILGLVIVIIISFIIYITGLLILRFYKKILRVVIRGDSD